MALDWSAGNVFVKYQIGDKIFWVESSAHKQKEIPCPMCFGKRFVTIILGDDSKEQVECGYCQKGYERSTGVTTTWEPQAIIHESTITGITTRDGVKYEVGWRTIEERELYSTREEAEAVQKLKFDEEKARAELWFKESFVNAKKQQVWSAGYHKSCIEREKRTIEWHEMRLNMIKEKKKAQT